MGEWTLSPASQAHSRPEPSQGSSFRNWSVFSASGESPQSTAML